MPDELKRALRKAERLFRCYQEMRAIHPEKAREFKKEWEKKVGEVEALARKDKACQELVSYLDGFGERGTSCRQQ